MANVRIDNVRLSYVHILKPYSNDPAQAPKYSATILLPKDDKDAMAKLEAAIAEAKEYGKTKCWGGVIPPNVSLPIHDGDGIAPGGKDYGPECKGCYVFAASKSSDRPVQVVDRKLMPISSATEIYSGIYANVYLSVFPYSRTGKKGIGFGLEAVQKVKDGEAFGGGVVDAGSVFSAMEDDKPSWL